MFCKKCNAELDDNSTYCSKCGKKQKLNNDDKMTLGTKIVLAIGIAPIVIMILLVFVLPLLFPHGIARGFVREATNKDIEIDYVPDYANNILEIIITPNKDIKELKIKIYYEKENGDLVFGFPETVGNVKEGIQVKEQIPLTEAILAVLFENKIIIEVEEGYVPYLQ